MTKVVRLFPEEKEEAFEGRSSFSQGWAALPGTMKKRSEGLSILKPLWSDHAKRAGGHEALLKALLAYLKNDDDLKRSGGPGLGPWLRSRRYEHWMEDETPAVVIPLPERRFPDEKLRAAFQLKFPDERALAWFDKCRLDGDEVVGPIYAARQEWLQGPFRMWAMLNGLGGLRNG